MKDSSTTQNINHNQNQNQNKKQIEGVNQIKSQNRNQGQNQGKNQNQNQSQSQSKSKSKSKNQTPPQTSTPSRVTEIKHRENYYKTDDKIIKAFNKLYKQHVKKYAHLPHQPELVINKTQLAKAAGCSRWTVQRHLKGYSSFFDSNIDRLLSIVTNIAKDSIQNGHSVETFISTLLRMMIQNRHRIELEFLRSSYHFWREALLNIAESRQIITQEWRYTGEDRDMIYLEYCQEFVGIMLKWSHQKFSVDGLTYHSSYLKSLGEKFIIDKLTLISKRMEQISNSGSTPISILNRSSSQS